MTATDPALQWCMLLILGFCFSLIKCGVCPQKVGKVAHVDYAAQPCSVISFLVNDYATSFKVKIQFDHFWS